MVEKYSPGVGQHPPVRFAVEAALALDSNNFVKFFKMVKLVDSTFPNESVFQAHLFSYLRKTTFLNACIMHGYFTVVRIQALKTMNRAHSVAKKPVSFPLSAVAKMLAFPNAMKVSLSKKLHLE